MKKRIDEDDDDDDDDEVLNNFKRVPSLYDESIDVIGADDVQSPPSSADVPGQEGSTRGKNPLDRGVNQKGKHRESVNISDNSEISEDEDVEDGNDDDDDDDDDDIRAPIIHGAYDPLDYEQLPVSEEIKDIFSYITKYTPQNIELENKLCPFLPDFIPAVGDIDAFVKVPRPDGKADGLGLTVLDEPCTQQSDPAVLQLQLRAVAKQTSAKTVVVKKIENPEKNIKSIERWIKAISDVHSTKPSPTVQYTKAMPNLDNLMQEWPPEVEEKLNNIGIPHFDLDCDLSTYVAITCNLFDIPVYESKLQSLHAFFSLYSFTKATQGQFIQSEANE